MYVSITLEWLDLFGSFVEFVISRTKFLLFEKYLPIRKSQYEIGFNRKN